MDSVIDKFAQRRNAQEMIKANAMAEAEEREKMAAQLTEYEKAMQEIRRCSLQNIENAEKVKELLTASLHKIEEVQKTEKSVEEVKRILETLSGQMKDMLTGQQERTAEQQSSIIALLKEQQEQMTSVLTEQKNRVEELLNEQSGKLGEKSAQTAELLEEQKKSVEELMHASDEFNHKEAVKVYRNVQAVIEGALPKQTEEITEAIKNAESKKKVPAGMIVLGVLTFAAAAANLAIEVLRLLGYL